MHSSTLLWLLGWAAAVSVWLPSALAAPAGAEQALDFYGSDEILDSAPESGMLEEGVWGPLDLEDPAAWLPLPSPGELIYMEKRARGWRGGGAKRQGGVPDSRYVCRPSRDDVVRLLLALHEARGGAADRTVNFCNRRRPASNVLTNLRFMGRKRR